jgi:hypothetical protein
MGRVVFKVWLLVGALTVGAASLAQDPNGEPGPSKRQVSACMSRRMASDRLVSYNDAAKACKIQLRSRKADTASNAPPKPVS